MHLSMTSGNPHTGAAGISRGFDNIFDRRSGGERGEGGGGGSRTPPPPPKNGFGGAEPLL